MNPLLGRRPDRVKAQLTAKALRAQREFIGRRAFAVNIDSGKTETAPGCGRKNFYTKEAELQETAKTHSKAIGYILWLFGFTGSHRFYYGRPISGTIYFFTFGLLLIGWIVDLFLIPSMDREASLRFSTGRVDYNVTWILLTFLGVFGIHRMYMGKWITGLLYLITGGVFLIGVIYDFWTLNDQITLVNQSA